MQHTRASGPSLRVVPLGGLGRIGGNMMVYETDDDMVVVDAGVLFPTHDQPGIDYVLPDIRYVRERRHKLRAIVVTHGHEDHIGALPWILPDLPVPVYATRFTLALLRQKLSEHPSVQPDLRLMRDREAFVLGQLRLTPLAVTHSIPDAVAIALETPAGRVVHTGDFKIDPTPLDGRATDLEGLAAMGRQGVDLLVSDSTNAEKPGRTWSEEEVSGVLDRLIREAPQRVFLTTFASHMDRLQAVINAAERAGRRVMALGRSMQQNIALGLEQGFLRGKAGTLVSLEAFNQVPRNRLVVLITGSQGEPHSALARVVGGRLRPARIEAGDRVILSSRRIPGNERAIGEVVNALFRAGAEVIGDHQARVHSSGHGFNDEQRQMIELTRPTNFLPVHGELRHMVRHRELAVAAGVPAERAWVVEDGQSLVLSGPPGQRLLSRGGTVPAGLVFVDGKGVGDVVELVLRDRQELAEGGVLVAAVVLSPEGALWAGPYLATRGLVDLDTQLPLVKRAGAQLKREIVALRGALDEARLNACIRQSLRRSFKESLDRRPVVLPVVVRLSPACCG